MSIGKNSIARAVNATANQKTTTTNDGVITKFSLDNIGLLSVAKTPDDVETIKASISKRGVLCPVLVAVTAKGDVWLVDGYRRVAAEKELKFAQITASVINVENKSEVNRIYTELLKTKTVIKETVVKEVVVPKAATSNIHEEKFRVLHVKDHDLPVHLL